ncbi:hypothetical protein JQ633_30875 [Bradyrhizobium tropiciagri]|uniref:hypothetical protein n=1 Tax=Bradyrhizobium tropiciagri TaxID=312253 RepID=UPI001BAC3F01|nr:hypothetical protein [Bradyrhizobium tropiciagri]MBR0874795.1 hypothetical protein [Bradyrhizobium tropiciagri]
MTDGELRAQSLEIAFSVLQKSGDVGDTLEAAHFLLHTIDDLMSKGERRRLLLSNAAIDAYRLRYQPLVLAS